MKNLIFLLITFFYSNKLISQEVYMTKWKLSVNIAAAFPQNKFKVSENSETILQLATGGYATKFLAKVEIYNHWSLSFGFSVYDNKMDREKTIKILSKDISFDNFYVNVTNNNPDYQHTLIHAGIIKSFNFGKLSFSPNLSIGMSPSFQVNNRTKFKLKEMGSNYTKTIEYSTPYAYIVFQNFALAINPNICFSYDIINLKKSKWGVSLSAEYLSQKAKSVLLKETYDIYGIRTNENINFEQRIELFNVYLGLYIRL